jgi:hypothetical protein
MKEQRLAAVRSEIIAERAASLRLSEQRLRDALAALVKHDSETSDPAIPQTGRHGRKSRSQLREAATTACLAYIIQRETVGLTAGDLQRLRQELGVPDDVWNAMGAAAPV